MLKRSKMFLKRQNQRKLLAFVAKDEDLCNIVCALRGPDSRYWPATAEEDSAKWVFTARIRALAGFFRIGVCRTEQADLNQVDLDLAAKFCSGATHFAEHVNRALRSLLKLGWIDPLEFEQLIIKGVEELEDTFAISGGK